MKTLHLVVRDPSGRIEYQAIGDAIVAADFHVGVTPSALQKSLVALALYEAHSPREAAAAMRVLADLGDVDFEESDFAPQWFQPDECIAVIDGLLERRRHAFAGAVRAELVLMRRALAEASNRGCSFYLVELASCPGKKSKWSGATRAKPCLGRVPRSAARRRTR